MITLDKKETSGAIVNKLFWQCVKLSGVTAFTGNDWKGRDEVNGNVVWYDMDNFKYKMKVKHKNPEKFYFVHYDGQEIFIDYVEENETVLDVIFALVEALVDWIVNKEGLNANRISH